MATESRYGWELPDLADVADGPDAFLQFANDVSDTFSNTTVQTYTPSWTSETSGGNPFNVATRSGHYRVLNKVVDFAVRLTFNSTTSGGTGNLQIGLPMLANSSVPTQLTSCLLWTPQSSASWAGVGIIDVNGGWTKVRPYFPVSNSRSDMLPWASTGGFLNLSVPAIPNQYPIQDGGIFVVHGRYFAA